MLSPPQNQDAGDLKSAIFSHLFGGCFDGCSSSVSVHLLAIEWDCHEGCISSLEKVYTAKCSALRRFAKSQKADSKSVECNFVGVQLPSRHHLKYQCRLWIQSLTALVSAL
jgi:hypothetical protein